MPSPMRARIFDWLESPKTAGRPEAVVVAASGPAILRRPIPAERIVVDQALGGESVAVA